MNKKITFFISDNIGEVDTIFPIVSDLQGKNFITNVLITNQKIYDDFQKQYMENVDNNILSKIKKLNFFFNEKTEKTLLRKIYKFLNIIFNLKIIFKFLNSSNIYFIENSFRTSFGRFLLKINNIIYKKTIICYPHGLRPSINIRLYNNFRNKKINFKVYHLSYTNSPEENEIISEAGYNGAVPIGYPFKSNYWEKIKKKLITTNKKQFLLLPRQLHQQWLNKKDASKLVIEINKSIKKYFPNYKLVIKLHPKDKSFFFQQLIDKNKMKNVVVSYNNIASEIVNSSFVICNLTSSIYMSYALNIPSIEIYTDKNAIKKWFPLGNGVTPYGYVGFKSINSFDEIEKYFKDLNLINFKFNLNISLDSLDASKLEETISK